jgi:hypothetical protein
VGTIVGDLLGFLLGANEVGVTVGSTDVGITVGPREGLREGALIVGDTEGTASRERSFLEATTGVSEGS